MISAGAAKASTVRTSLRQSCITSHDPSNFVNLNAFATPCTLSTYAQANGVTGTAQDCEPGTRHFGNEGRNSLRGPTFKQWDFAIYKNTQLTERLAMQLRAEFFNILNHPNFSNPFLPAFIADPATTVVSRRTEIAKPGLGGYQLTATGDVGIGNPFLGGGAPRGIQLAAKFTF